MGDPASCGGAVPAAPTRPKSYRGSRSKRTGNNDPWVDGRNRGGKRRSSFADAADENPRFFPHVARNLIRKMVFFLTIWGVCGDQRGSLKGVGKNIQIQSYAKDRWFLPHYSGNPYLSRTIADQQRARHLPQASARRQHLGGCLKKTLVFHNIILYSKISLYIC